MERSGIYIQRRRNLSGRLVTELSRRLFFSRHSSVNSGCLRRLSHFIKSRKFECAEKNTTSTFDFFWLKARRCTKKILSNILQAWLLTSSWTPWSHQSKFASFHLFYCFHWTFSILSSLQFEIQSLLGEGSYGTVWKAIHKKSGVPVAIKKVPFEKEKDLQDMMKEVFWGSELSKPSLLIDFFQGFVHERLGITLYHPILWKCPTCGRRWRWIVDCNGILWSWIGGRYHDYHWSASQRGRVCCHSEVLSPRTEVSSFLQQNSPRH